MSQAKQQLELAIECLHRANQAQQKAFGVYPDLVTQDEDVCYAVHNSIEDVIQQLEEVLDAVEEWTPDNADFNDPGSRHHY